MTIERNLHQLLPISIHAQIGEVLDKFRRHMELTFIPVINEFNEPIGIIRETSLRLYTHARFGRELIQKHKTSEFLSPCPVVSYNAKFQDLILTPTFNHRKEGFIVIKEGKYAGFLHTLTLLDLYEEHRLEVQKQLFQTQKMESIGTLAGGIAHDFNNILASISGHVTMIKMRLQPEPDANVSRYISTISDLCKKASNLTQQLLGFARGGQYRVEPLNLNEIIQHVASILTETFPKDIVFNLDLSPGLHIIEGDRGQVEQVLMNLLINARDAMPKGGNLNVSTCNRDRDEVEIRVKDSGTGIPEEIQKKIFEPFFTTKERGKGTGMGLAMVYGIIQNHGGNISVESNVGIGTTFVMNLPTRAKNNTEKDKSVDRQEKSSLLTQAKIMVVDDDVNLMEVLDMYLKEMGCTVYRFNKGEEAVEFYERHPNEIAVVLLDMIMPGMSGQQVYKKLYEFNPNVEIIFMSGYNTNESMQAVLKQTNAVFLQKPFTYEDLKKSISNSLIAA